jgi:serine/threonine protein phosphatase PrpC
MKISAYQVIKENAIDSDQSKSSYLLDTKRQIFAIADGISDLAGNIYKNKSNAIEPSKKILLDFKTFIDQGFSDEEITLPFVYKSYLSAKSNLLFNAVYFANQNLCDENGKKQLHERVGASFGCVFIYEKKLTLLNVGSTSVFLFRSGELIPLVVPHNWIQRQRGESLGAVLKYQAAQYECAPIFALGIDYVFEPFFFEYLLSENDEIILTNDQVYPWIHKDEFLDVLNSNIHDKNDKLLNYLRNNGSKGDILFLRLRI